MKKILFKRTFGALLLVGQVFHTLSAFEVSADSLFLSGTLDEVEIVASTKQQERWHKLPLASLSLGAFALQQQQVKSLKELSALMPNFYQPDYGSRMTSSIYIRGLGSRMEQPVLGITLDGMPVMNKNQYDFDWLDVSQVTLLRGPQGTLYGRNTSGGMMEVRTLSPHEFQGTKLKMEGATYGERAAQISLYRKNSENFAYMLGAQIRHRDGFFRNSYRGDLCDKGNHGSLRFRMEGNLNERWKWNNILSGERTHEGGYAYFLLDEKGRTAKEVNYNSPSGYRRTSFSEAFTLERRADSFTLTQIISLQGMYDNLQMDNDFLPADLFTLMQTQKERVITEELTFKWHQPDLPWKMTCGLFAFGKDLRMKAPVTFGKEGIEQLILQNANAGLQTVFPEGDLQFLQTSLPVNCVFELPTWGAALFQETTYRRNRWAFTVGLRVDGEQSRMQYDCSTKLDYLFSITMDKYKLLCSTYQGTKQLKSLELLPKVAVSYDWKYGLFYASFSKGFRTGGFNTQLFSDILKEKVKTDLMGDLGVYLPPNGASGLSASATTYRPERHWNSEIGAHLHTPDGLFLCDVALFYLDCRNQQLTTFPPGTTTGRMMSNAGRSHSWGGEWNGTLRLGKFSVNSALGWNETRFIRYAIGTQDYKGNRVPYAPQFTASLGAGYSWFFANQAIDLLSVHAEVRGIGPQYWDEANTLREPFYGLLSAQLAIHKGIYELRLWGRNLTQTAYHTFYFRSMDHAFYAKGKPRQVGFTVGLTI